jgi:hypothetical protein
VPPHGIRCAPAALSSSLLLLLLLLLLPLLLPLLLLLRLLLLLLLLPLLRLLRVHAPQLLQHLGPHSLHGLEVEGQQLCICCHGLRGCPRAAQAKQGVQNGQAGYEVGGGLEQKLRLLAEDGGDGGGGGACGWGWAGGLRVRVEG